MLGGFTRAKLAFLYFNQYRNFNFRQTLPQQWLFCFRLYIISRPPEFQYSPMSSVDIFLLFIVLGGGRHPVCQFKEGYLATKSFKSNN